MDYTTLTASKSTAGSISAWINSDSVTSSSPTIIAEAESFVYRRLRHWRMLTKVSGSPTFTIGNDYIALPSDYLEAKLLMITGVNQQWLTRKTIEEVTAAYQYDGSGTRVNQMPLLYSNDGSQIAFDSPSDQAYPYLFRYYAQPAALSGSNTTNWLTQFYPRLFRTALMAGATEFMKEAGQGQFDRTYWEGIALTEIGIAQVESDMEQRKVTGGAMYEGETNQTGGVQF